MRRQEVGCPKEYKGGARRKWFEQHKSDIIATVQQKGQFSACEKHAIGYLALLKNLHRWGLPATFGLSPVAPVERAVANVRERVSTLQVQNAQIRLELDKRLISAGVQITIRMLD